MPYLLIFEVMLLRVLIFLFPVYGFCQSQYRFSHFTAKDGLPQNSIHCTFKDSEGYYWFGTQDGLCRYDGYAVKNFRHNRDDSASISDNFILAIAEDKFRNLWVGTRNGINRFDRKTEKFKKLLFNEEEKTDYHNTIWFVACDGDSNIVFTNPFGQLIKVFVENNKMEIVHSKSVLSTIISGAIYCRQISDTLILYYAKKAEELWRVQIPDSVGINALCEIPSGDIIAGTNKGLLIFPKNKAALPIFSELKNKRVKALLTDSKNNLWVGTSSGLYVIKGKNSTPELIQHTREDLESLSNNSVQSIYEDPDGLLWIGTSEGGVNIYDPYKDAFRVFHHSTSVSLSSNSVHAICVDRNELWLGTLYGLNHFVMENENISGLYSDKNKIIRKEILTGNGSTGDSICSNYITSIVRDKNGNIWFGSQDNGISIYHHKQKKWENLNAKNSSLRTNTIFHLMCATDSAMWISTNNGCYRYNDGDMQYIHTKIGYIFSVYEDRKENIWVGTTTGITRLTSKGKMVAEYVSNPGDKNSLSYNMATSFFEDSSGNFWVATLGGGLNLMNRDNGTFRNFTAKEGLASDVVYCILEDNQGKIWLSSNGGLSCFDAEEELFNNYSEPDGIVSKEFITNAAFKSAGGELLFGSPEGLVAFYPEKISFQDKEFPVILTSLKINYIERNYISGEELELFSNDKTISFEFSAPDFRNQHQIFYSFMLEGFERDWHDAPSNNRVASYTNLPFGEYTFKIRIRKGNNDWQQKKLSIKIRIIPPFWLKGWFIALEILAAVIIIALTVKYYSQRKLRRQLHEIEMQQKIHIERERISRDLHDNVGSNLTYITTTLDNISYKMERDEKELSQEKISSLSDFTRSTMQQLRETIWAINKESVGLSQFKDKVNEHLSKMLSNENNMNFTVQYDRDDDISFKPSVAIHLFRIVQEAVNNCVKHSEATTISVTISASREKLVRIKISDDGKGFDVSRNVNGHYGIENMRSRIIEIGGTFKLSSGIGKGTDMLIEIPVCD